MPTYQYACTECGHELEAVQKFTDEPLTVCPECEGRLRKRFSAVGVVFKGSGFYKTDSRSKTPASSAKSGSASTESGSSPSKESSSSSDGGGGSTTTPASGGSGTSKDSGAAKDSGTAKGSGTPGGSKVA